MQRSGKIVPDEDYDSGDRLNFTEQELINEWSDLYQRDIAPLLGAGEKTVTMIEQENHIDHKTAKSLMERWEAEGVIVKVGKRRTERGITVDAWRLVTEKVRLAE